MIDKKIFFPLIIVSAIIFFLLNSLFIVNQINQAIVLRFGEFQRLHKEPGLKIKVPFIEDVMFYETRMLDYDLPPISVTTEDQKRLVVETYTRYIINDPLKFFQAVKPATEVGAKMRLEAFISSSVRNVMGKVELRSMLTDKRSEVMQQILQEVGELAGPLGIKIIDVRIIRSELPPENRSAVFARMNSELILFAKENRAKGEEAALLIRAQADKERTILLAEANKTSLESRGAGDAKALEIAIDAYSVDPEFYDFYRSLEAYGTAFKPGSNYLVTTENEFSKFLTKAQ